jgi:hypothetical protein
MRRLHLFEFGDQPWFPQRLRDAETAYLAVAYRLFPLGRIWAEKIATLLHAGEPVEILDLCSGSGGAMPSIIKELEARGHHARATLTDLYPNPKSVSHPRIVYLTEPVDAARVPPELAGVRTMCAAFHHFRPDAAKAILKDAFDRRKPICIFEGGQGSWFGVAMVLPAPLHMLVLMPFARPFRWSYLVFTYLIPVMPLILLWDGIVSMLRIYSPSQMKELTQDLQAPDYVWEIGRILGGLPYLVGSPGGTGHRF